MYWHCFQKPTGRMFETSNTTSIKQAYVPVAGVLRPNTNTFHTQLSAVVLQRFISTFCKGCGEEGASGVCGWGTLCFPLVGCSAVSGVHFAAASCTQVGGRKKENHQHNINIIESFWEAYLSCGWNCSVESLPVHCNPPAPQLHFSLLSFLLFPLLPPPPQNKS